MNIFYRKFVKEIYTYCDKNIGDEFLFPFFVNFWHDKYEIKKRDLARITSKILSRLINKNPPILREIRDSSHETVYSKYKILPHKNLIFEENPLTRKLGKAGEKQKILEFIS